MNRLKIRNTFTHAFNRHVCFASGVTHCCDFANVNNPQFYQKSIASANFDSFACFDNENHEIRPTNIVRSCQNKTNAFRLLDVRRNDESFDSQNSVIGKNAKVLSSIVSSRNYEIRPTKIVGSCQNKTNAFRAFDNRRNYGFFGCQNSVLAKSSDGSNGSKSNRCFSDSANRHAFVIPGETLTEGFWKDLCECAAVEFCQDGFVWLHATTGLPWWATIVVATWGIRAAITLPLALYQNHILAKVENLKFEMNGIVKELKTETNYAVYKYKWTEDYAREIYNRSLKKEWQKLIERENCHPLKSIVLVIVQIPMWIVVSTSLRNLCYMLPYPTEHAHAIYLELTTGGFAWITNLTLVDHSFVLPVTLGLLNLTIIEMQNLLRSTEPSKTQKYQTNFFRLVAVGMVSLASYVPAGMCLYWTSSSAFGIVQNLLLMSPRVRRVARIPPTDGELEKPYRHLYQNVRRRIGLSEVLLQNAIKKS